MAAAQAESLMATVAATLGTTVGRDSPILEGELPLDGSRFQALLPPVVSAPVFAIRRRASALFDLDHYVDAGVLRPSWRAALAEAVATRRNILPGGLATVHATARAPGWRGWSIWWPRPRPPPCSA